MAAMRQLLAIALLAACSSSPPPMDPVPLPPDPEDGTARTGPTPGPDEPDDPIGPPTDDRPKARAGTVTGADGKQVDLAGTWAESNVVVIFYRGAWCKLCRKHLTDLQASYKDLLHAGAHLYAVSVDAPADAQKTVTELGLQFPVLSDTGGALARSWGVLDEATGVAKPATFLIARGGGIAFQHVGHTPADQPGGYALLQQVKQHLPAEGVN
jgi:peroxiredoxin